MPFHWKETDTTLWCLCEEPTHKTKHNGFIVKKPTLHEGLILNIKKLTVFIPNEQIQNERFIAMKTTQQDRFKV